MIGYDHFDLDTLSMLRAAGSVASIGTNVADQLQVTSSATSWFRFSCKHHNIFLHLFEKCQHLGIQTQLIFVRKWMLSFPHSKTDFGQKRFFTCFERTTYSKTHFTQVEFKREK